MTAFEYKVIPAPSRGRKAAGVKGVAARFAHTLEAEINALAADGWAYLRSDILPSEEHQGLTASHTVYRSVLVFQRAVPRDQALDDTRRIATPDPVSEPGAVENEAGRADMLESTAPPDDADLPR